MVAEEERAPSAASPQPPQSAALAARAAARRAPRSTAATAATAATAEAGVAAPLPAARAGEKAEARVEFSAKDQARMEELRAKLGDPVGGRGAA